MDAASKTSFDTTWLKDWLSSEVSAGRIKGCALEVINRGETVFRSNFGNRTPSGDPITFETQFWIASMTKPIVSILAMRLIEQGVMSLLDPVARFVPGFGEVGVLSDSGEIEPTRRPVTVLDLLIHSSGVTYGQFGKGQLHRRYADAKVFDYSVTNSEIAARLAQLPLLHQPGTYFEYGMSTDVLGRVIEVAVGQTLDKALKKEVFDPLGMHDTGFEPDTNRLADLPASTIQKTVAPDFSTVPAWHSGGAGLFSTLPDYCRFAEMLLAGGQLQGVRLVKPETLDTMLKQHLPAGIAYGEYTPALGITAPGPKNGLGFGLGFAVRLVEVAETPGGEGEFFWPGVSGCNFWIDPKNDLVTVFLTHAPEHRTEHRVGLKQAVYAGLSSSQASTQRFQVADCSDD